MTDDLKDIIENTRVPKPNELARARITKEAMLAFKQAQAESPAKKSNDSQGIESSPRLTNEPPFIKHDKRNTSMKTGKFKKPQSLTGLFVKPDFLILAGGPL